MCGASEKLTFAVRGTKYLGVEKANLAYRKRRKRTKTHTRKLTRHLLNLLGKILNYIRRIERENACAEKLLTARHKSDMGIITRMYRQ